MAHFNKKDSDIGTVLHCGKVSNVSISEELNCLPKLINRTSHIGMSKVGVEVIYISIHNSIRTVFYPVRPNVGIKSRPNCPNVTQNQPQKNLLKKWCFPKQLKIYLEICCRELSKQPILVNLSVILVQIVTKAKTIHENQFCSGRVLGTIDRPQSIASRRYIMPPFSSF